MNEITEDIVQELFRPGMRLITGNLELNLGGLAIRKPIEELTLTGLVTFSSQLISDSLKDHEKINDFIKRRDSQMAKEPMVFNCRRPLNI